MKFYASLLIFILFGTTAISCAREYTCCFIDAKTGERVNCQTSKMTEKHAQESEESVRAYGSEYKCER